MKILFLIRSLENGGAERQLSLLANQLGQRHSVSIAVFYTGGVYEKNLDSSRVRLVDLRKGSRWDVIGFAAGLARLVRRERPDIIHGYLSAGNLAATFAKWVLPSARSAWGIRDSKIDADQYRWVTRLAARLLRVAAKRTDLMIFNSNAALDHWRKLGYAVPNSVCIPNGINTGEFCPDPAAGAALRAKLGIPDDALLIGMVARMDPAKDYPSFLQAAAIIAPQLPNARFLCLGEGDPAYRDNLMSLAAQHGIPERFSWPEPTRDMKAVYNSLDVFCLSSHAEGFPNVVAEAMACGRHCVVSDVGDAGAIVGDCGWIVPPGSAQALAAALLEAAKQPRRRSDAARLRIEERFSIASLAARTESAMGLSPARAISREESVPAGPES